MNNKSEMEKVISKLKKECDFNTNQKVFSPWSFEAGAKFKDQQWREAVGPLVEALRFYADKENIILEWDENTGADYLDEKNEISIYETYGYRAQKVLSDYEAKVK